MPSQSRSHRPSGAGGILFILLFSWTLATADDGMTVIDSARELHDRSLLQSSELSEVRLTGLVLGIDKIHRSFALQDTSGCVWIATERLPAGIAPGNRMSVRGKGLVGNGVVWLGFRPLVDAEYETRASVGRGNIHLTPGYHPFELEYEQMDGPQLLGLTVTGPAFTNRPVSGALLWHRDQDGTYLPGVDYEYLESSKAGSAPTNRMAGGVTNALSLSVAQRSNYFGLRFAGAIHVKRTGIYEFHLRADDNARLTFPYDPQLSMEVLAWETVPKPVPLSPGQRWPELPDPVWAEAEGIVRQAGVRSGKIHLEISTETGRMQAVISGAEPAAAPLLVNSRVRVTGLASGTIPPGAGKVVGSMLVPSMENVAILTLPETIWATYPPIALRQLHEKETNHIVQLHGVVRDVVPGEKLILADGSARVEALTARAEPSLTGTAISLLGRHRGSNRLDFVTFRIESAQSTDSNGPPTLTTIEQIRRLKPDEVIRSYPVKFQGVVTFVFQGGLRAHVQGEREGIYVACVNNAPQPVAVGDLCEFEGVSSKGAFSPVVTYRTRKLLGRGHVPAPLQPDWSQLANGSLDAQWIEIEGVVLRVSGRDLVLGLRGGEVAAHVFDGSAGELGRLLDAVVRVRGTVRGFATPRRQQRVLIQITSPAQITVQDGAPDHPFDVPARSLAELYQFDPNAIALQRVRTRGQVIHVRDGIAHLMDGTNGMRFSARSGDPFACGDLVEAVGFPDMEGYSLFMRQAVVRAVGKVPLPPPRSISEQDLFDQKHDSTLVELTATIQNVRTNESDYLLDLQAGRHSFLARMASRTGVLPAIPSGSRVKIAGLYSSAHRALDRTAPLRTFELYLNSPNDVVILEKPSWWNIRKALTVLGLMTLVLAMSVIWIGALRRRVDLRTRELREEIEFRKRTEADLERKTVALRTEIHERKEIQCELEEKKSRLETEIEERRRMEVEVETIHQELVRASHQAGQAEVASSVLHNVGNVLNSVNVSATLVSDGIEGWKAGHLAKAADLLRKRSALLDALAKDDPARQLPEYLDKLAAHFDEKRAALLNEVKELAQNINHIKEIVAMQQTYAKLAGVSEKVTPAELVESAFKINAASYERHGVRLVREFTRVPELTLDRHKVMQILVNLFQNAKTACEAEPRSDKTVTARVNGDSGEFVVFEIADNGVGIAPENMKRLFSHGFTTRKDGHGFGLHSAAIAAKELGGSLSAHSDGIGRGATFTLRIPIVA